MFGKRRLLRSSTLKQRVFGLTGFLSVIPLITLAATFYLITQAQQAQKAMDDANAGVISLSQINASLYAVVMESRGIYMSADAKAADPFAKGMEKFLAELKRVADDWKRRPIAAEAARIDALSAKIDQFIGFRRELLRLALEKDAAAAREFGDNDANRKTRTELNAQLVELAKAYEGHKQAAEAMVRSNQTNNLIVAGAVALIALLGAGIGCLFVHRTVIKLFSRIAAVTMELAGGKLDARFDGIERKDEIGEFARAFQSLKEAGVRHRELNAKTLEQERQAAADKVERERVNALEREEADKRAAADREAATARVMNELDAAVGGIVKAAMQGDFSQRVPLEGRDGVIRNLAAALNSMCDDIGGVMDEMVAMMSALADGDLTRRIHADYRGTFATLKDSANATAERLSQVVGNVKKAATDVANAASEISASTTELSHRTEQQSAGLQQTTASMQQMAGTVKKNADNAHRADQLTANTRTIADRGGQVVGTAVAAMSRIDEASRKIADIIDVIDEIARQTNLLALNAAVEAARAGDAGRGFAVVAAEVRSLAQRSSQAAKDITGLISNSNLQVKEGVDLVNRAGASLAEIVESIKSVAGIVSDIAGASSDQADGIAQVNKAIGQMDDATQQNSALVEENAATAKTLEKAAEEMVTQVSFFRIDEGRAKAVARAA